MMKSILQLVKRECCNHQGVTTCVRCIDSDNKSCVFFRGDRWARCPWFENTELTKHPDLQAQYWARFEDQQATETEPVHECARCGKPFTKASNRQKFCAECRDNAKREADRNRKRRQRA